MKKNEVIDTVNRYLKEERRWNKLKVGQVVYIEFGRFFDMEYYAVRIDSINIDDRYVSGFDYSTNKPISKLSYFFTKDELIKRGIKLVWHE